MNTYHLWLKPSGMVYDMLMKTIADLSKAYQAPLFEPHVTLLSSLPGTEKEITARASQLGTSLQTFDIHLTEPAYGEKYFECVFLKARKTRELVNAHEQAGNLFAKESSHFMPHVSLLYGHYSVEHKTMITATLPESLCCTFAVDTLYLISARSENPKDWASILTVPLSH